MDNVINTLKNILGGIQDGVSGVGLSWFNFHKGEGFVDVLTFVINIAFTVLALLLIAAATASMFRYVFRFLYSVLRNMYLGHMVWNEVVYEGVIGEGDSSGAVAQMENMKSIMPSNTGGVNFGLYYNRRKTTTMIRLDPDDESAHMYIGISSRHYDENEIKSWASGANCSVERVDFSDIGFVPSAPTTLIVEGYDTANITKSPTNSSVGTVISHLQTSSAIKSGATAMITFEPMRESEEEALKRHIATQSYSSSGEASMMDRSHMQVNEMLSSSPCRAVFHGFSDTGDYGVSRSVLSTVQSSISSMGIRTTLATYPQLHRTSWIPAVPSIIILAVLGIIGFIPFWISLALVAMAMSCLLGIPLLSTYWVNLSSRQGSPPIPPYKRVSLQKIIRSAVSMMMKNSMFGSIKNGGSHAPSTREIVPIYQTSLMQFASMPMGGYGSSNISTMAVPQVAMSTSINPDIQGYINDDKIALIGTSVKSFEPTLLTADDLNFGIAIGGGPGSGKTYALNVLYMGHCHLSRMDNRYTINPIWMETKSDDLSKLTKLVAPYKPLTAHIHDREGSARLCLEGGRFGDKGVSIKDVIKNKNILISAMEKLWGPVSFGPQSKMVADAALTVSMLLRPNDIKGLGMDNRINNIQRPNVIKMMSLLIGSDPSLPLINNQNDGPLEQFAVERRSLLLDPQKRAILKASNNPELEEYVSTLTAALDTLTFMLNKKDATDPFKNKLHQLASSDGLWETTKADGTRRKEYSISKLIEYGGPVIMDLTATGSSLSTDAVRQLSMFSHYMLWQKIQEKCSGWANQKKYVPLFVDEITNLTGRRKDDSDLASLIGEIRDQGRSYGVSHNVGFQQFGQIPQDTENTINTFASHLYMNFGNIDDSEKVMRQLGTNTRFTTESFKNMPTGYAVADLSINGRKRAPFTLKVPNLYDYSSNLLKYKNVMEAQHSIADEEKTIMSRDKKIKASDSPVHMNQSENRDTQKFSDESDNSYFTFDDGDSTVDDNLSWS